MLKILLRSLVILLLFSGCGGEGIDGRHGAGGGIGIGDIEFSEEALECATNTASIINEYNNMIEEARELEYLESEPLIMETINFWENYSVQLDQLKVSFESEGGDAEALEEKLFLWEEEMGVKIDELMNTSDTESQEWRDATRLLDLELAEGIVKLFSAGGIKTEELASQFLDWFKENKKIIDENEDKSRVLTQMLEIEIQRLETERDEAVEELNCG
ncbi:hypothetical protein QWY87_03970 [Lutimonas halocynthiae]|uniref:hypothetical protein n=1 Tax=Lutimonas halocynthiae TaxID=1446477 RepID=UPI0025B2D746|nr:hypothetical protein [Lutimonas halocynthiae]MDN3641843.1 hypothetical protein [Lutimonas halocynthiae]